MDWGALFGYLSIAFFIIYPLVWLALNGWLW